MRPTIAILQRLCDELEDLAQGAPHDREQWRNCRERAANLALTVLRDEGHPLAQSLASLRANEVVIPPPDNTKKNVPAIPYDQNRRFFTPQPGSAGAAQQQYWPLQLLLYTVATSTQGERLIDLLTLSKSEIESAVRKAHASSVEFWSFPQHARYLAQAIKALTAPAPDLILSPDYRTLSLGGTKAKLSAQHGRFMRLVLAHRPNPVPPSSFASARIAHPAKTKARLLASAARQGIQLTIAPGADSYTLVSWDLSPLPVN